MTLSDDLINRAMSELQLDQRRSRFSKSAALFYRGIEIAHAEGPDRLDIRLTQLGIRRLMEKETEAKSYIVSSRRDWIEVNLTKENFDSIIELVQHAAEHNRFRR